LGFYTGLLELLRWKRRLRFRFDLWFCHGHGIRKFRTTAQRSMTGPSLDIFCGKPIARQIRNTGVRAARHAGTADAAAHTVTRPAATAARTAGFHGTTP